MAANTAPLKIVKHNEVPDIRIRYAENDEDVCNIHRFLLIVAEPAMRAPVDPETSLLEIIRVAKHEAAIMVMHNGVMVGTMGLIRAEWWYAKNASFLTDRWHFVLPSFMNTPTSDRLLQEAKDIAAAAGIEFIHQGKIRPAKNGVPRLTPRAYQPA